MNKLKKLALLLMVTPLMSRATLAEEVAKIETFMTGSLMKTGIIGATIAGFIGALLKGSLKGAVTIMAIGIFFAFFLGWVKAGTFAV